MMKLQFKTNLLYVIYVTLNQMKMICVSVMQPLVMICMKNLLKSPKFNRNLNMYLYKMKDHYLAYIPKPKTISLYPHQLVVVRRINLQSSITTVLRRISGYILYLTKRMPKKQKNALRRTLWHKHSISSAAMPFRRKPIANVCLKDNQNYSKY